MGNDYREMPADLPRPKDDGVADHLFASRVPDLSLPSTLGGPLNLASAARGLIVVYVYPRTGTPGGPLPEGWDEVAGARGCTPQSCAFRDHAAELAARGASVIGISAQSSADQLEFARREHIPYPLLSDDDLQLAITPRLPTFEIAGMRLYKRLTFIARAGRIEKVFYPVFPPERNASDVLAWLQSTQPQIERTAGLASAR
jgi:peroxiredoxin